MDGVVQFVLSWIEGGGEYCFRRPGEFVSQWYLSVSEDREGAKRTLLALGSGRPPHQDTKEVTFFPSLLTRSKIRIAALVISTFSLIREMADIESIPGSSPHSPSNSTPFS